METLRSNYRQHIYSTPAYNSISGAGDQSRQIKYGDRIFVRVSMRGRAMLETYIDRIEGYSELVGAIRNKLHGAGGLAHLWIRNQSRGWSIEKPLMFYTPSRNPSVVAAPQASCKKMLSPWETH